MIDRIGMSRATASIAAAVIVASIPLPALAASCGEEAEQRATMVEGRWVLGEGSLVTLDGTAWRTLPGSSVETVSVETGSIESGEAVVSAAVVVPGGAAGEIPALAGARTAVFRGVASCDIVVEVMRTASSGELGSTEDPAESAYRWMPAPVFVPPPVPAYRSWVGRVR